MRRAGGYHRRGPDRSSCLSSAKDFTPVATTCRARKNAASGRIPATLRVHRALQEIWPRSNFGLPLVSWFSFRDEAGRRTAAPPAMNRCQARTCAPPGQEKPGGVLQGHRSRPRGPRPAVASPGHGCGSRCAASPDATFGIVRHLVIGIELPDQLAKFVHRFLHAQETQRGGTRCRP